MKLADLIDRLVDIHNSKKDYNPEVSIMTETSIGRQEYQLEHGVTDVASSTSGYVIIIGQELD